MSGPPAGYRPCVGLAVFNPRGEVFLGRRANKRQREHVAAGYEWQMPQGGIDPGEDIREAALRELAEETSITSVSFLAEIPVWLSYDLPSEIAGQAYKGRFRGQTQKWVALRFEGQESEINVEAPVGGHKAEFDGWRWAPLAETPSLIIPFKRAVYDRVVEFFAPFAGGPR